jgi:hypothetical protein
MRFIRNLSLEVVIGAVLYQCFLYQVYFHAIPSYPEMAILALVVWFLYLLDRQIDNLFQPVQDERHRLHLYKSPLIRILLVILGVSILCLLPFQRLEVLFAGFSVLLFILLYGYAWHKRWLRSEKELFTALLYAVGVGLVVWVREPKSILLVLPLIALAYQNLCYFNLMESPSHFYAGRLRKTEWILVGLLSGIYAATQEIFTVLPFLVTFGITFVLSRLPFSEEKRLLGDMAFWSPLIYLFYGIFSA